MMISAGLPAVGVSRGPLQGKRRFRLLVTLAVTSFVLVTACSSGGEPSSGGLKVTYFGEGTGTSGAAATLQTETGGTIQLDVSLPIRNVETGEPGMLSERFQRGDFLYISLQNKEDAGSVTCRIEVNGKVIDEATSSGAYVVVSCQGRVP